MCSLPGHRASLEPPTTGRIWGALILPSPRQQCSPQGWHCPSGHQEDMSLSSHIGRPRVQGVRDQRRQGEHHLPLHHSRGPALT